MQQEITINELPAPGEPLKIHIDEDNQELLDQDFQERIKRQRSRLTRREIYQLKRRLKKLHKQLNDVNYNELIIKRWEFWNGYQTIYYELMKSDKPDKAMIEQFRWVAREGRRLNEEVKALKPLSDEFDEINHKLQAHNELIAWEIEDEQNRKAFIKESETWEQQIIATFEQSPRLHHRWQDTKGNWHTTTPKIREIIIKDDRVLYHIETSKQNAIERLFGRWHSCLPYGVDVPNLMSEVTLENLSTMCNRIVTVERSKRGTNLFYSISRLDAPDGIPKSVLYQKCIDWYPTQEHNKTPWIAGIGEDRKVKWFNFEDIPHILIAGATQGGKSNHINQMLATLTTMNTPDQLRLLLIDLKGGIEFTHWQGLQHQLKPMLTSANEVLEGLSWLHAIMDRRLQAFEQIKAKNLTTFNDKAKNKIPRIVCAVDEMATLIGLGNLTKEIHNELRVLSAQGRAVGIHLLLCTQHSSVDVLPGWVKTNMGMRVSAKMPSHQASMVILDSVTAATLPNVPGRMVFSLGREEYIAQSPFISDLQVENALKLANSFPPADNSEFEQEIKPQLKFSREDAIRMAITQVEGKLSPSRVHGIVGNDVMSLRQLRELYKGIAKNIRDDGGILFDDIFYEIKKAPGNTWQLYVAEDQPDNPNDEHEPDIEGETDTENVQALDSA